MKDNVNILKKRRPNQRRYRAGKRRIKLLLLASASLVVLVLAAAAAGNAYLHSAVKPTDLLLMAESKREENKVVSDLAGNTEEEGDETEWCLILVNKWHTIPKNYKVKLTKLSGGESVDARIYPALQRMFDAARADNIYPIVASGYRSAKEQQRLMDEKINTYRAVGHSLKSAKAEAEKWVGIQGTSEHQLGIAVDINADGIRSGGDEVYEWLDQNAYRFGFIRRYPKDKTEITGVSNEPWHYRYVGVEAATEIYNQKSCLEEYLGGTALSF